MAFHRGSVRRLPGPFTVVAVPPRTNRRVSGSTCDGYSSRSQPAVRDVAGSMGGVLHGVKRPGRCRPPCLSQLSMGVAVAPSWSTRRARATASHTRIRLRWPAASPQNGATTTRVGIRADPCEPTSKTRVEPGGEGGIRTHGVLQLCAFQERRLRPLGHLSAGEDTRGGQRRLTRDVA